MRLDLLFVLGKGLDGSSSQLSAVGSQSPIRVQLDTILRLE
jgi:hypothetical protein